MITCRSSLLGFELSRDLTLSCNRAFQIAYRRWVVVSRCPFIIEIMLRWAPRVYFHHDHHCGVLCYTQIYQSIAVSFHQLTWNLMGATAPKVFDRKSWNLTTIHRPIFSILYSSVQAHTVLKVINTEAPN